MISDPIMLAFSVALFLLLLGRVTIGRTKGALLFAAYLSFIAWVALHST